MNVIVEFLLATTNKGDAVFDPFLGTGTTAVACKGWVEVIDGVEQDKDTF